MEAGEPAARQSGITSASNPELYDKQRLHQLHQRDPYDRQYREQPHAMATAALISPSTPYHGHPPSFSSSYPHSAPPTSIAGMISPVEPRRGSDDSESSHRQSLPSISEVINKATAYPPQPTPSTSMPGSGFPSPYGSAPSRSSFAEERHSPPRPVHPSYTPVSEPNPTYAEPGRSFSSSRPPPPPPLSTLAGPNRSPPMRPEQEAPRSAEAHQVNGSYSHMPPAPSHYPPGQQPLPPFTGSPGHAGPAPMQSPYESQVRPTHHDEDFHSRGRYDQTVNRHFEQWSYQDHLARIATSSRTVFNFAEAYGRIAQEQHSTAHIPERWPSEREVAEMIGCADYVKKSLESLRDVVQSVMAERARESGKAKGAYDEEDVTMYGDGMKPQYSHVNENSKKRRGRAAPPGRCHSCNRIDTPEWRRGPDGARTLCNACGLHYAKLERKRQLEARSIRPKPDDQ